MIKKFTHNQIVGDEPWSRQSFGRSRNDGLEGGKFEIIYPGNMTPICEVRPDELERYGSITQSGY